MANETMSDDFLERIAQLSPKRLALLAAELERRLRVHEAAVPEPIAIIGLGCRMPGGAETPEAFWDALINENDAIETVPASRWDVDTFYDPVPGTIGKINTKWGGFVNHIDEFDTAFFGIAPKEAIGMDPQQRMLLEVSWEALENACVRADSLDGSSTGVFVGISTSDYASLLTSADDSSFDAYSGSGAAHSVAAGRISYFLGLKGPSLAVDTACSSSALAIHLACQSLRQKECRMALAGGVNALLLPQVTITLSQAQMLAGDGRCKTFSRSADGFVRSEGCGMIVLKRLTDAQADGDRILGVVRGSATNHDGRSSGLTAPNGPSQEAVIKAALAQARIRPEQVSYVEAHGTGTVLGDAIELGALGASFTKGREANKELLIGSVKTNIGHMEAAAGVAGVIKVLLAMQHQMLPAHLHMREGQANDALQHLPLRVPISKTSWHSSTDSRIAGVSSFGFSGANVHIVLEEAPSLRIENRDQDRVEILTVSAKSKVALSALCARYATYLRTHPEVLLTDVAFSLNAGRSLHPYRIAIKAASVSEALTHFQQIADSSLDNHPSYRFVSSYKQPVLGFLFTGQGSQYAGMGVILYQQSLVFRNAIDQCDKVLFGRISYPLAAILCGDPSVPEEIIHDTTYTQPALFAFEYALAVLWQSWGVRASIMQGHSLGEYAAACIAGVFSLDTGLALAYERGRLMGSLPLGGSMLAIHSNEAEVAEIICPWKAISIAAVNTARSVVVSGDSEQIEELRKFLSTKSIASQPLKVSHAFHSALMDPILDKFEHVANEMTYDEPKIPLISNVTGKLQATAKQVDANYWRQHLRSTVRFEEGFATMLLENPAALLEIGPDPVLLTLGKTALASTSILSIPTLRHGKSSFETMHEALMQLYLLGVAIDWNNVYQDRFARKLELPTYPFQRQQYWIQSKSQSDLVKEKLIPTTKSTMQSGAALYVTEWQTQPESIRTEISTVPAELIKSAEKTIQDLSKDPKIFQSVDAYERFLPRLNMLCTAYVLKTLRDLGIDLQDGIRISIDNMQLNYGIGTEHCRLIKRMFSILEEDGFARREATDWILQSIPTADVQHQEIELLNEFPEFAAEINFLNQSRQLAAVLRGHLSPVEALFPNGSFKLAENVYQDSVAAMVFNRSVATVIRNAVESYSSDRTVKIIEVGAGTGSTTSQVVPALSGLSVDYLFTDISPAFLTFAQTKFADFPFIQYGTLDLENEASMLVSDESTDLILAANVLHATADLKQTLTRIRRLLRKGGTLVILEGSAPQRFGDLTVGMTKGWWRFTDTSIRESYPLLPREHWLNLLTEVGFECTALAVDGALPVLTKQQTILIARRPFEEAEIGQATSPSLMLIGHNSIRLNRLSSFLKDAQIERVLPEKLSTSSENRLSLLQQVLRKITLPSNVILDLQGLSDDRDVPERALENASLLLEVIQSIARYGNGQLSLWVVTQNAFPVSTDEPINLPSALADAMMKTARLEHPDIVIRCIDLPLKQDSRDLKAFSETVRKGTLEHSLAIRNGYLIVPRLCPLKITQTHNEKPVTLIPKATYLVTGAFGGLGFRTAQWMADCGATCIFMVGRHEPSQEIEDKVANLRSRGVRIENVVADVSRPEDVITLFGRIGQSGLALRGIVHAAGSLSDATLLQQTPARIANVFASKVHAGWLLHEASKSLPLDFFVFFGSAASILGAPGQSNHAAANGFLDALSHFRRQLGLPSTTIAWGPWSEIGAATQVKKASHSIWSGMEAFSPEDGVALLNQSIISRQPQVSALHVDWQKYLAPGKAQSDWPFYDHVRLLTVKTSLRPVSSDLFRSRLEEAPLEDQFTIIQDYLYARLKNVLQLDTNFVLRDDQVFAELGLDSLMALELKNDLQKALGEMLPSSFFFEYPTLHLASTFLNAKLMVTASRKSGEMDTSEREELTL